MSQITPSTKYETKFKSFVEMCARVDNTGAKASDIDTVLIDHPEALGDDYAEIVESLNRLSAAGLKLFIVPPAERAKST